MTVVESVVETVVETVVENDTELAKIFVILCHPFCPQSLSMQQFFVEWR